MIKVANRFTISPSFYKYIEGENYGNGYGIPPGGHRRNDNITEGGQVLLIDCDGFMGDGTPQYKIIEKKLEQYHYA